MTDTRARPAAAGDDVVARLRDLPNCHNLHGRVFRAVMDAAAAIEARDAEIARLRAALAPPPASDGGEA